MKSNNKNLRKLPFLAQIANPVRKYYWKCSEDTQNSINQLGLILLLSEIICGCIFALAITRFILKTDNNLVFLLVFCLAGLFYYVIDRALVLGSIFGSAFKPPHWLWRFSIAVVLGLLNSQAVNLIVFNEDIKAARQKELQVNAENIRTKFEAENFVLHSQRRNFLHQRDSVNAYIIGRLEELDKEVDGTGGTLTIGKGPVWEAKYESYKSAKALADQQIATYQEEINFLERRIEDNRLEAEKQIAALQISTSHGINDSVRLVEEIVFKERNFTNLKLFFIILVLAMMLELIPLITKKFYDLSEYFELCRTRKEVKIIGFGIDKDVALIIQGYEFALQQDVDKRKTLFEKAKEKLENTKEFYTQVMEIADEGRSSLEMIDNNLKKQVSAADYDKFFKPIFEICQVNLHEAVEDALKAA